MLLITEACKILIRHVNTALGCIAKKIVLVIDQVAHAAPVSGVGRIQLNIIVVWIVTESLGKDSIAERPLLVNQREKHGDFCLKLLERRLKSGDGLACSFLLHGLDLKDLIVVRNFKGDGDC